MIYICIPAHNEERTVGVVLWKIRQVMASFPRDYQLLVADDGSTDDTAEVLSPYQRVLPLTVVKLEKRAGYASALELLMREAVRRAEYPKRDVIVTLQADFTDDPDELLSLLKRIEAGADIVAANAALPALAPRALRWPRQVGNYMLRRRGMPEAVLDPLCGMRAYRVIVVKRALEARANGRLLTWDGWAANSELLQITQPHSRRTEGIDIIYRSDRQQRPSRNTLWPLLFSVLRHARGGTGPLASLGLPVPASTDARERRKPTRRGPGRKDAEGGREAAGRERSRNGRSNGRGHQGHDGARPERPRRERRPEAQNAAGESKGSATERPRRERRPGREEGPRADRPRDGRERPEKRRRAPKAEQPAPIEASNGAAPPEVAEAVDLSSSGLAEPVRKARRRRRKRKRGGRNGGEVAAQTGGALAEALEGEDGAAGDPAGPEEVVAGEAGSELASTAPRKRRSRRGGRGRRGRGRAPRPIDGSTQGEGDPIAAGSDGPAPEPPPQHPVDSETS